jgi:hypothetical protein
MKSKRVWAVAVMVMLAAGVLAASVLATPPVGLTTTTVAEAPFPALKLESRSSTISPLPEAWRAVLRTRGVSDVYVVDNKLAPGGTTGWHTHPGPSLIFVVAGTVTNYRVSGGTCTAANYPRGTGFVDSGGADIHMLKNNGAEQAETIAVQFIPHGAARKIDEPQPTVCPS